MQQRGIIFLLLLFTALTAVTSVHAQIRRGAKTSVRSGRLLKPDTLARGTDSLALRTETLLTEADSSALANLTRIDSLGKLLLRADSTALDSIRRTLPADSATLAGFDALRTRFADADSTQRHRLAYDVDHALRIDSMLLDSLNALPPLVMTDSAKYKRGWFMSDSMSLSKVCWLSVVLPGYGQIYNKQYWKLPILYGTLGTALGLFIHENKTYKPLKRAYDKVLMEYGTTRTPALEEIQTRMIRSNTRRQLYLGASIASYLYFIGDVAVKYSTNDVSQVKKATTLACICPGAGQIYNKSYWKVPFVVGGFAALIYCIDWNNRGFQRFKTAYTFKYNYDQDPDPVKYPNGSPDEFNGRYSTSFLKNLKDSYRRNRDLCIIITAGLYLLQIVDAHVDAHLKDYDISDDLSMNIEPMFDYTFIPSEGSHRPVFGFNLSFKF